jgi:hypothetical protein
MANTTAKFLAKVLLLAARLLLFSASTFAQGGSISGNVFLPNGAFLNERARITLMVDRGVKSNSYTDEQGRFQFGGLTPALYEIIVEPDGNRFEKARAKVEVFKCTVIATLTCREERPGVEEQHESDFYRRARCRDTVQS